LVGYKAKDEKNGAFEMVVYRAINLGKMKVDTPEQIKIDDKNSKIFMMSKVATPFIKQVKEGQKNAVEYVPNTKENLVEVKTGVIDAVYKIRSGKGKKRPTTKDVKMIANNMKAISKAFFVNFEKAINYSVKKKPEFFDMVDDQVWESLSNIFALYNSKDYQTMRNFSEDFQVGIDGKTIEKKDKTRKIA
jgi:hypothetical protein